MGLAAASPVLAHSSLLRVDDNPLSCFSSLFLTKVFLQVRRPDETRMSHTKILYLFSISAIRLASAPAPHLLALDSTSHLLDAFMRRNRQTRVLHSRQTRLISLRSPRQNMPPASARTTWLQGSAPPFCVADQIELPCSRTDEAAVFCDQTPPNTTAVPRRIRHVSMQPHNSIGHLHLGLEAPRFKHYGGRRDY